jgi:hypothetical protein
LEQLDRIYKNSKHRNDLKEALECTTENKLEIKDPKEKT